MSSRDAQGCLICEIGIASGGCGGDARRMHAFLPGAGLGTRLRPITDELPKPLVPLFHRPLVEHALDACLGAGAECFAVNTHHLPGAWAPRFPTVEGAAAVRGENGEAARHSEWRGRPLAFFHEPVLLETGGGVRNVAPWFEGGDLLLVHNADIFSTMDLGRLVSAHRASGLPVTLALRSHGPGPNVSVDSAAAKVLDLRGLLGRGTPDHQFTGIYCTGPELFGLIAPGDVVSAVFAFVALAEEGRLGCVVLDDGAWMDLGDPAALLDAHLSPPAEPGVPRIHPQASIDPAAEVDAESWAGPGAAVPAGTSLRRCLVFPGADVAPGEHEREVLWGDGVGVKVHPTRSPMEPKPGVKSRRNMRTA